MKKNREKRVQLRKQKPMARYLFLDAFRGKLKKAR